MDNTELELEFLKLHASLSQQALGAAERNVSDAIKLLTTINSGAALASLAFAQALIGKKLFLQYKVYALAALALFLLGSIAGAFAFFELAKMRIYHEIDRRKGDKSADRSLAYQRTLWVSYTSFLLGCIISIGGLVVSF